MPSSSSSSVMDKRICNGCLLHAKPDEKMMKCSRCQSVMYHNRQCQIQDYPKHKDYCRKRAIAIRKESTMSDKNNDSKVGSCFECRYISNERGRGVVALRDVQRGKRIDLHDFSVASSHTLSNLSITVLSHAYRSTRCANCFCEIDFNQVTKQVRTADIYIYCSNQCEENDELGKIERNLARCMNQDNIMNRVIPTSVIIVARIFYYLCMEYVANGSAEDLREKKGTWWNEVNKLVSNYDETDKLSKERYSDLFDASFAWFRLTLNKCQFDEHMTNNFFAMLHRADWGKRIVGKVMMNCFTMFDGTTDDIGVALFPRVSVVNHSCYPNTLQTFEFLTHSKPKILLTICRDVNAGDEILIPYLDVTKAPTHERIFQLKNMYKFVCKCDRCLDIKDDDKILGIRCLKIGCHGYATRLDTKGVQSQFISEKLAENDFSWQCNRCETTNFSATLRSIDRLSEKMKIVSNGEYNESDAKKIDEVLEDLKLYCLDSSIFIRRSKELLCDIIIHTMHNDSLDHVTFSKFQRVYSLFESLNQSECQSIYRNFSLDIYYRRILFGKLHLSLFPDINRANDLLRSARDQLSLFLPAKSTTISQIDDLLKNVNQL